MSQSHLPKVMAGKGAILAGRYALALLELAEEKKQTDAVSVDLDVLADALSENVSFSRIATHPRVSNAMVEELIKNVAAKARFNALTTAFLYRVAANRRVAYLDRMISSFQEALARLRGQSTALVVATRALTEEQKAALSAQLGKMTGGEVDLVVQEDKDLLGGLVIKVGSRLIDASIKGKLAQIERQLKSQREAA